MDHIRVELEFIPVAEGLPEDDRDVLCLTDMDIMLIDCMSERCMGRPTDYGYTPTRVCLPEGTTHWAKIPHAMLSRGIPVNDSERLKKLVMEVICETRHTVLAECEQACLHMGKDVVCPEECAAVIRDIMNKEKAQ